MRWFSRAVLFLVINCSAGLLSGAEPPVIAPTDAKSPADERAAFKLPPGFEAQLVASEPDILKPMQIAFDAKGRLWVNTSREYPFPAVGRPGKDKLYVLEDFAPDGKARKITTFADDLNIPIGVLPLPDGKSVLVSSIDPGEKELNGCWIWKLTDTDGDGKGDKKEKLYGPFSVRDTHGMVNSFTLMPDGWVYACHGYLNESKVKGKDGHEVVMQSGSTFRFRLDGSRIEVYTRGQVNPFGMAFDPYFNLYTADCHSKPITQLIRGAVYESFGKPHDGLGYGPNMINHDHGSTALCGLSWYEADHFPAEFKGTMFLGNVVTNRINFDKIEFVGSTPKAVQQPDFLVSDDPWFRPVDIKLGPDGALYVSDFYNKIIGHYEVDLKHPGRDRTRGRLWRIVWKGLDGKAPAPKSPGDLMAMKSEDLDKLLESPNIMVRHWATQTIIERNEPRFVRKPPLKKILVDESELYIAQKSWANIGLGIEWKQNPRARIHRSRRFVSSHYYRILTARAEWSREHAVGKFDDTDVFSGLENTPAVINRAQLDFVTSIPSINICVDLFAFLQTVPTEDTHLRHATKIALRETLRDAKAWPLLLQKKLSAGEVAALADVATGLPTKEAAAFLTSNLSTLAANRGRLVDYVEHAARYGDDVPAVSSFVQTHKPTDIRLSLAILQAYQRGLQQRGKSVEKSDKVFGEALVLKGLNESDPQALQTCFELTGAMKLDGCADAVATFASRKDRAENQRSSALGALYAIDPTRAIVIIGKVLSDADEGVGLRERAAQVLGGVGTPPAYALLLAALEKAPARLQTGIAAALAAKPDGADQLLKAVAAGKASARLLQERSVQVKLDESKLPKLAERIAELTKGLPTADEKMAELMNKRRDAFGRTKADAKLGAVVYKTSCANCHQLGGEGAKVGPQLDGIGIRGLERLLEDILDPSRNVDQAMRSTTLNLKDGRSISGLVLREEGAVIVMADALGKEVRIEKKEVDDRRTSLLSPMPANFNDTIKEEDFHHLMAFLLTQRAKDK